MGVCDVDEVHCVKNLVGENWHIMGRGAGRKYYLLKQGEKVWEMKKENPDVRRVILASTLCTKSAIHPYSPRTFIVKLFHFDKSLRVCIPVSSSSANILDGVYTRRR